MFKYTVDDEEFESLRPHLTDFEILEMAGLDTTIHILKEVVGRKVIDTPRNPDLIHVDGRRFLSIYMGATTNA